MLDHSTDHPADVTIRQRLANYSPSTEQVEEGSKRGSAILILLTQTLNGAPGLVLVRRAEQLRRYGGDWGFPGGKLEPEDDSAVDGLHRELKEELGLTVTEDYEIIGRLDDFRAGNDEVVRVFVGIADRATILTKVKMQASELADLVVIPLESLRSIREGQLPGRPSRRMPAYFMPIDSSGAGSGEFVWGLSCSVLVLLRNVLENRDFPVMRRLASGDAP
jgi:8-oxo-dGTP pyrophosphatase MutT (NUDIX family)